ncbi:MAG: phosphatase PAP2 family protein [Chthoniobacterales bacterium]|nr:phosphatase PAP2 family protein [Chthoniobacterales bacterium]
MDKTIEKKRKVITIFFLFCFFIIALKLAFIADGPVRLAIVNMQGPTWNESLTKKIVAAVSRYGDWPELMFFGVMGFLVARYRRSPRWQKIFLCAMVASTLAGGLVNTLRLTTGRTRPRVAEQHWYGPCHAGKWTIGTSEFNSFPSGHTATAVGFATVILLASPAWGAMAMMLAVSVAGSRLLLGAHHPSDLLAAFFVAIGISWCLWYYTENRSSCSVERLMK